MGVSVRVFVICSYSAVKIQVIWLVEMEMLLMVLKDQELQVRLRKNFGCIVNFGANNLS